LRAIENGHRVRVVETEYESLGVDTPADLERVSALFEPALKNANLAECTEGNVHG
jgi:CMP-2-keto-3-deoxyoctulosonic acid synthetase